LLAWSAYLIGRRPCETQIASVELWGLGDLVIATRFLQQASEKYEVTLVAKPFAQDLKWKYFNPVFDSRDL